MHVSKLLGCGEAEPHRSPQGRGLRQRRRWPLAWPSQTLLTLPGELTAHLKTLSPGLVKGHVTFLTRCNNTSALDCLYRKEFLPFISSVPLAVIYMGFNKPFLLRARQ